MEGQYSFTDLNAVAGAEITRRPAEAMLIDGQYIEDLIPGYSTLQVSGRELLSQSIEKQTIGKSDGELIQYVRNPSREIVVGYRLAAADDISFRQAFYKLNSILHGDSHQVSFNDDPSKYWIATLSDIEDVPKGRNAITSSFTLFVPDGIAHSVVTKTADNMPYKDVPVNLQPDSNFTQLPSTWTEDGVVFDNSGEFAKLTSNGTTMQRIYGAGNPFASIPAGSQYTISFTAYSEIAGTSLKIGLFDSANLFKLTTTATYYKFSATKNLSDANALSVILLNAEDIIYIKKVKIELGASASPWSPNPADPEYYSDTITVPNLGTAPTAPIISATMHGDNGLVAFVNDQGGVLQFGDPEEIDGETRQKSERVLYEGYDHAPSGVTYNNAATNYPNYIGDPAKPNSQRGTIGYADTVGLDPSKGSGATPTFTNGDSGYWGGPSYQLAIKPNSNNSNAGNFLMKTRFYFATSVKQTGRLEITLQNGDEVAYSAVIRDSGASNDEIDVEFWVQSKLMDSFALNRKDYNNGMYRELVIGKLGSKITMQISAVTEINKENTATLRSTIIKNYQLDYMADVPVTTYSVWFERMRNMNHVIMDVTDTQFSWVNVNYWQDLPNRWNDGDVITADVANKAIYVNGVEDMTLHTVGNQWDKFMLQPGENTIEAIGSSWCTTPLDVSVQFREAYY